MDFFESSDDHREVMNKVIRFESMIANQENYYFDCEESGEFEIYEVLSVNFDNFFVSVDADCFGASGSAYVSIGDIEGGTAPFNDPVWYIIDSFAENRQFLQGNARGHLVMICIFFAIIFLKIGRSLQGKKVGENFAIIFSKRSGIFFNDEIEIFPLFQHGFLISTFRYTYFLLTNRRDSFTRCKTE